MTPREIWRRGTLSLRVLDTSPGTVWLARDGGPSLALTATELTALSLAPDLLGARAEEMQGPYGL